MVNLFIKLILKILPSGLVSDINELSLEELDKRGWIIWESDKYDKN